jgi:Chaperone of endosialidase
LLTGGTLPSAGTPSIALRSSDNVVYHQSGSANNIVLLDSSQNTMYSVASTAHIFAISNSEQMRLTSTGFGLGTTTMTRNFNIGGSNAAVGMNMNNTGTSGRSYSIFSTNSSASAVGALGFYDDTAGAYRMVIDSSGNLLVGATTSSGTPRLYVKGSSTSATDLGFFFVNSAGSTLLAAYNNGALYADNMKSGAGTNAVKFSTSTGQITYDTSSARYKDNIRDSIYGLSHVMQMRSTQFEYKDDKRSDVGLIAEELYPIIPELVGKNKDGEPDSVSYDRMVSVLVKAIQEQQAIIQTLTARIEALESKGV